MRTGKVKIDYGSFCTATCNLFNFALFTRQEVTANAAGQQDRLWQFVIVFLERQGLEGTPYVTKTFLKAIARAVPGLDFTRWQTACAERALTRQVKVENQAANRAGAEATPTLFFHGPGGGTTPPTSSIYGSLMEASAAVIAPSADLQPSRRSSIHGRNRQSPVT